MYHTWYELTRVKTESGAEEAQAALSATNSGPERRAEQPLAHKAG